MTFLKNDKKRKCFDNINHKIEGNNKIFAPSSLFLRWKSIWQDVKHQKLNLLELIQIDEGYLNLHVYFSKGKQKHMFLISYLILLGKFVHCWHDVSRLFLSKYQATPVNFSHSYFLMPAGASKLIPVVFSVLYPVILWILHQFVHGFHPQK